MYNGRQVKDILKRVPIDIINIQRYMWKIV